ncbi:MAG: serine/threonine protein kinase, partial [Arthrobacter sp.]|nr:serine/threonine protein kinase [Arthrobacter sp.]
AAARHCAGGPGVLHGGGPVRRGPAGRGGFRAAAGAFALCAAAAVVLAGAWLLVGERLTSSHPGAGPSGSAADAAEAAAPDPPGASVPLELRALLESPDPQDAVRGLAGVRSLAFRSGDFGLLEEVNVPGSPAAAADGAISSRLTESGVVLAGFSTTLTRVEGSPDSSPTRAVVAVSAASSPYQERDAAGAVVAEAAAGGEQRIRLVLVPVGGRWRIQEILPEGSPSG